MAKARLVLPQNDPARAAQQAIARGFGLVHQRIDRVKQSMKSPTMPLYDPDFPDDAVDGQHALRDGIPYYYWDGAWHPFGGSGILLPCRIRMWAYGSDQTIPSGLRTTMFFNDIVAGYDATVFDPHVDGTGVGLNQINILQDGGYSILSRSFWSSDPDDSVLSIFGVDASPEIAPYNGAGLHVPNTSTGTVSLGCVRLKAGQQIYVTVYQASGSDKTLDGDQGNFLEITRLGDVDTTGTEGGPP